MRVKKIADDPGFALHSEAMMWVDAIVIDLKAQLLGYPSSELVTMDRLNEWHKHRRSLEQCREAMKLY